MPKIIAYMAHDPVCNMEEPLTVFDADTLSTMEARGIVFVAVYDDDSRAVVKASEIVEPEPQMNGITLVTPTYVDKRTAATVAVFDALAAIVDPEASAVAVDETGETTETANPVETFKTALSALKELAAGGSDD